MNTAFTALAWLGVVWMTVGLAGAIYVLIKVRKDWDS